jgi:hypothetical protein
MLARAASFDDNCNWEKGLTIPQTGRANSRESHQRLNRSFRRIGRVGFASFELRKIARFYANPLKRGAEVIHIL